MPRVFTILCHGTNSCRDDDDEIIPELARMLVGTEYRDFLVLDGPGSKPKSKAYVGKFNPYTRNKERKKRFGKKEMGHTHINTLAWGTIYGAGWNDNVIHAIACLAELEELPEVINMAGWSRGAVTCTKIAYALNQIFPQIKINIYGVDPVAGPNKRGNTDCKTLNANVDNYCAILAMDENRKTFRPQSLKRLDIKSRNTNIMFLPFPGNHAGVVKVFKPSSKGIESSPKVIWHLAYEFLTKHGTRFKGRIINNFSDHRMLELYADMVLKRKEYRKAKHSGVISTIVGVGLRKRDFFANKLEKYVNYPQFFINLHHYALFRRNHRMLYQQAFVRDGGGSTRLLKAAARKLITSSNPQMRLWLELIGYTMHTIPQTGAHDGIFAKPRPKRTYEEFRRARMGRMGIMLETPILSAYAARY